MTDDGRDCPCGSGKTVSQCCGRYISGSASAATAEQLMRSRYSAYVLGDAQYLEQTWHPQTRPVSIELDNVQWLGLKVRRVERGSEDDDDGVVEFVARYKIDGRGHRLHEVSRFLKLDGRWFYLDGSQAG